MANLFWKTGEGLRALPPAPFKTEEELESMVFDTSELLEDIFVLKRQVRGGKKTGIPDIVGIDTDGNVCIIEIKNCEVGSSIIPQVLNYAFWAETNPDSIKSLWLECDDRPDDITVAWDDLEVRILIIAPSILRSTLDLVEKINYPVDLIEIKRWGDGDKEILFVNRLEPAPRGASKPASGQAVYDEKFYKTIYNSRSVDQFLKYCGQLETLVKREGWKLDRKFNKLYCGFKAGFFNAFGIRWVGSKTFALFFILPEEEAKNAGLPITKHHKHCAEVSCIVEPGKTKIADYKPLFELAYKRAMGDVRTGLGRPRSAGIPRRLRP